jgi:hypothetical protein
MPRTTCFACAFLLALAAVACGGRGHGTPAGSAADDGEPGLTAADLIPRAVLVRAALTTEVDRARLKAVAPPATEFQPTRPEIFLVATLRDVPTQARIEVRWYRDARPEPFLESEIRGSDVFTFVSSAEPPGRRWRPGSYTVRVLVDEREVGAVAFTVTGDDPAADGPTVRRLQVATGVDRRLLPKRPGTGFERGTAELFAAFEVVHLDGAGEATVNWFRGEAVFSRQDVALDGDGRFVASVTSPEGLPDGRYQVAVELGGEERARAAFTVGCAGAGPGVDRAALGLELDGDNMPVDELGRFGRGADAIRLGMRFLDLPAGAVLEVRWLAGGGEWDDPDALWHTTRTAVPGGGSGTMGAAWPRPPEGFGPGGYRAVIGIDGQPVLWKEFTIE